jgi:hypothetical protein
MDEKLRWCSRERDSVDGISEAFSTWFKLDVGVESAGRFSPRIGENGDPNCLTGGFSNWSSGVFGGAESLLDLLLF